MRHTAWQCSICIKPTPCSIARSRSGNFTWTLAPAVMRCCIGDKAQHSREIKNLCNDTEAREFQSHSFLFCISLLLSLLSRNPFVGAGLEKIERQRSPIDHRIVKGPDIELGSQFLSRTFAKFAELELA